MAEPMTNEQLAELITTEIGGLRSEMRSEIGGLRSEMRSEISRIDRRLRAVNARITKLDKRMMSQFKYVIREIRRLDNGKSDSDHVDEDSPRA